jgi:hypothetical protein
LPEIPAEILWVRKGDPNIRIDGISINDLLNQTILIRSPTILKNRELKNHPIKITHLHET